MEDSLQQEPSSDVSFAGTVLAIDDLVTWVRVTPRGCSEGLGHVVDLGDKTVTIRHGGGRSTIPRTHVIRNWGN